MTTTIAALIAVTILHDETESPEDKLIDMIEASGEAEVMDSSDALICLVNLINIRHKGLHKDTNKR